MITENTVRLNSENRKETQRLSNQLSGADRDDAILLCLYHFADRIANDYGDHSRKEITERVDELKDGSERRTNLSRATFVHASDLVDELPLSESLTASTPTTTRLEREGLFGGIRQGKSFGRRTLSTGENK